MKASITKTEIKLMRKKADETHFKSSYGFLNIHNGFRNGNLHLFIAPASAGKSTLVRSLLTDLCMTGKIENALLWLSEEDSGDFLTEFYRSGLNPELARFDIISEMEELEQCCSASEILSAIELRCNENEYKILFLDNITTSKIYMDRNFQEQSTISMALKKLAEMLCIPIVVMAHTGGSADLQNRLIEPNDIRGGKSIINLVQFCYILQPFRINETIYPTLRITKHRGQDTDHSLYRLIYSKPARLYGKDEKLLFSEFKEVFNTRNKL